MIFCVWCFVLSCLWGSVDGKVAVSTVNQLLDPCQFPLPSSSNFPAICQSHYHEVSWLCDPFGLLSRTEAELLSERLGGRRNLTGCFCHDGVVCHQEPERLRISLLLVPYGSVSSIDACVSRSPFAASKSRPPTYTLATAAAAYAREIARRWASQCPADLLVVYIQNWRPEDVKRPFVVRILQNKLVHYPNAVKISSLPLDVSPFHAVFEQFNDVLDQLEAKPIQHVTVQRQQETSWLAIFEDWGSVGGVPIWAFVLGSSLLLLVIIAVYMGNVVTHRLAIQKQMQKKQSVCSMRLANERWRTGSTHYSPLPGNTNSPRPVKSTMMFRQFSGDNRRSRANFQANTGKI